MNPTTVPCVRSGSELSSKLRYERLRARQLFVCDHKQREASTCAACGLRASGPTPPNVSGWERLYVNSQHLMPFLWRFRFIRSLEGKDAYGSALRASVRQFGLQADFVEYIEKNHPELAELIGGLE